MNETKPGWKRMGFKGNKVWMAVDENQRPVEKNGKVLIKYQTDQDYEYWVHKNSLISVSQLKHDKKKTGKKEGPRDKKSADRKIIGETKKDLPADAVLVFTDGASSGNPGPSGIGVLMLYKENEKSISRYIGEATNNIAELKAIHTGLLEIKNKTLPVRVFTDSGYAYGVLSLGWKARKNMELIDAIKKTLATFKDIKLIKIKGHAGVPENEKADKLAVAAIKKKASC